MVRAEHGFLGGASDAGKSTLLREGHENFNGVSVWANHAEGFAAEHTEGVAGHRAEGREAMQTGVGKYDNWSDVRINLKIPEIHQCVQTAVGFAIDVWDSAGVPTMITVDECHHLFFDDGEGVGTWILREGRDNGIKGMFGTQNPQSIGGKAAEALMNVRYWGWVGEYPQKLKGWLQYYGYPIEELPRERFRYHVYSRSMEKLFEGETKEEYGG